MKKLPRIILLLFALLSTPIFADWRVEVDRLLDAGFTDLHSADCRKMNPDPAQIASVAASVPSAEALLQHLQNQSFAAPAKTGITELHYLTGSDGVERPWVLFIPQTYDPAVPNPALIALHGGVSRVSIHEDPLSTADNSPWLSLARAQGWFAIFPFGQENATWWDEVGMANIKAQLRLTRRHFNLDDNRVYLAGFSDGASGGFLHAMLRPDDFAAVVALNGHLGVGNSDGDLPTYVRNLANTPIYAVTTDDDDLYPTAAMAPIIEMALKSGADIFYRQLEGKHDFAYAASEMPVIADFLNKMRRRCLPPHLTWESAAAEFSRCRWLEIAEIADEAAADWHQEQNLTLVSDRISIGIMPKQTHGGVGVRRITPGSYAAKAGLHPGDLIVKAGNITVAGLSDLDAAKAKLKRGDFLEIAVLRGSDTITLQGHLPPPEFYYLFSRGAPSAAIRATQAANRFFISASRVKKLHLYLFPQQIDFQRPLRVEVNGREVFNQQVRPNPTLLLAEFCRNRDRQLLPLARIELSLNE